MSIFWVDVSYFVFHSAALVEYLNKNKFVNCFLSILCIYLLL